MALRNQGSAAYVQEVAQFPNFDQDFTFCFWARFPDVANTGCIWSMSDNAAGKHLNIGIRGGKVGAYAYGGGAIVESGAFTANQLYFFALRFQGTTARIWWDDYAENSATNTRPTGAGVEGLFLFGNQYGDYLKGTLRDWRRYSKYLSTEELQTIFYSDGADAILEIIRERFDFCGAQTAGQTLSAFTNLKVLVDRPITVSGVGASTSLDFIETRLRSSLGQAL